MFHRNQTVLALAAGIAAAGLGSLAAAAQAPAQAAKPPAVAKPPVASAAGPPPTLLGQFGDWGAYTASPGGKKVCFTSAKPANSNPIEPAA